MTDLAEIPLTVERLVLRKPMPKAQFDPLAREIFAFKKQLNAVILAHNYQVPEIQDVADYVGDSLGLSQQAAKTEADVIVFCGVHFMAETAKILNPQKIVVLPDKDAGCSLEESCPANKLREFQKSNPNFWTIAYINCSAEVKALSDAICSTEKMITWCQADPARQFIVVTESGIIHRMQKECPGKEFICAPVFDAMKTPMDSCRCSECKYMKMNTLKKVRDCMARLAP